MDTDFTPPALRQLEEELVSHFGVAPPLTYRPEARGKASRHTHVVATDSHNVRIGLKYVSAHFTDSTKTRLLPTENIVAAAQLSSILATPSIIDAVMMGPIDGLGPLAGRRFAARRWHGQPIDSVPQDRLHALANRTLEQCGEWVAFGLLFALADGKIQHWTWDDQSETIGRCDLELLFFEEGKVGDYRSLMTVTGATEALRSGQGERFADGVRRMLAKFHARRDAVDVVLGGIDEHTRRFLANHAWATLSPDEFLRAIEAQL